MRCGGWLSSALPGHSALLGHSACVACAAAASRRVCMAATARAHARPLPTTPLQHPTPPHPPELCAAPPGPRRALHGQRRPQHQRQPGRAERRVLGWAQLVQPAQPAACWAVARGGCAALHPAPNLPRRSLPPSHPPVPRRSSFCAWPRRPGWTASTACLARQARVWRGTRAAVRGSSPRQQRQQGPRGAAPPPASTNKAVDACRHHQSCLPR